MIAPQFRTISLVTIVELERRGWRWAADPRRGPQGKALRSPRGTCFEVRMLPLSVRRYEERRFADAA
jgi:hypothetical protein